LRAYPASEPNKPTTRILPLKCPVENAPNMVMQIILLPLREKVAAGRMKGRPPSHVGPALPVGWVSTQPGGGVAYPGLVRDPAYEA